MEPIKYLDREAAIGANQIAGESGAIRDENVLGSALAAPQHAAYYEGADLIEQAAILIQRVAMAHAFVDGNKRTAFILGSTFLMINGLQFDYRDEEEELDLAQEIEKMVINRNLDDLVQWIETHIKQFEEE